MAETFYPFVEADPAQDDAGKPGLEVRHPARIAVYDDPSAAPRVVVVDPADVRSYLEEITATVSRLVKEQGGQIPFMVIREIVENLIHAYFAEPAISILDGGNTIRFADQGPGIANKELAMEYGTTSATGEMKRYIRGVGSGLPYAQQWLEDKGGTLRIEDNISRGTVVTITLAEDEDAPDMGASGTGAVAWSGAAGTPTSAPPAAAGTAMAGYPQAAAQVALPYAPMAQPPMAQPWPQAATYVPYPAVGMGGYQQGMGGAAAAPGAGAPAAGAYAAPLPQVSERGMMALGYLASHGQVGPTELVATFGHSQSTWTRELKALEDAALVAKRGGQKRFLTPLGQAFLTR